jgi:hypothetical protein
MLDTTLGNLALIAEAFGDEREPWLGQIRDRLTQAHSAP